MKGLFIPDITTEMFRNGCLEGIEALMAEGELYDIEYNPKQPTIEPERKKGKWIDCDGGIATCSICGDRWGVYGVMNFCPNCGASMGCEEEE